MTKISKLIQLSILFSGFLIYSQEKENKGFNKENFLKELSDNACKCIDSIDTKNSKDSIAAKINKCIDSQSVAYQLGIKISKSIDIEKILKGENQNKKDTNIIIETNKNTKEYKEYYYEMESYLMDNCPAIKSKIASSDEFNPSSNNSEAIKYYNLGQEESKKENYAKAAEYYKKAVVFDPDFVFAYDNLGITYRKLQEYDKAIEAYEKSLKLNPNGLMPLQNIAVVYQYKKDYKKSVKTYEKLAKLDSKNPEVFYGIGHIYAVYLAEYEKALNNLCEAYNIYVSQNSPYRADAEKLIQIVYSQMKKEGKEKLFEEILNKHNIKSN